MTPEILSRYLSGFTTGVIGPSQVVRVQFAHPIVDAAGQEAPPDASLLTFSPPVAGELAWENTRTLTFAPEENWKAGSEYTATVNLKAAYDTITGPTTYHFSFTIRKPNARVEIAGLYTPDPQQLNRVAIGGTIRTNDPVEANRLNGLITATQGGGDLPVDYLETGDLTYEFVIGNVKRGEEASSVSISWDADGVGLGSNKGSRSLEVPAIGDFKLLNVTYENTGSTHLSLRFSDPLDEDQDLTGLIRIPGAEQPRFQIAGNVIKAYVAAGMSGSKEITVNAAVRNVADRSLGRDVNWRISFTRPDPELRTVGNGVILPHSGPRLFPFEAIGLEGVLVEVFKIYENNVLQFLQDNELGNTGDDYSLHRVGRIVSQDRVRFSELAADSDLDNWTRYALDLTPYVGEDPQAIYQVRIGFGMEDVRRICEAKPADFGLAPLAFAQTKEKKLIGYDEPPISLVPDYYGLYGYYADQEWEDRDDVCKPAFYNRERFLYSNVLSSNVGIIVKQDEDRRTVVVATDLVSGRPLGNAEVQLYDFQQQPVFRGTTDGSGYVEAITDRRPAFATVTKGDDAGYLKIDWDSALPLSKFDVGGAQSTAGVKGAFFAERGVWRPGDSVFLQFVLEDRLLKLPPAYPVNFELYDAQNRLRERRSVIPTAGDMYPLHFKTDREDPTGNWRAVVKAGGQQYQEALKIETVKPNRLAIDLDFGDRALSPSNDEITLRSSWLHGAPANGLKVDVEMQVRPDNAGFSTWPQYVFSDPARKYYDRTPAPVHEGNLNADGTTTFNLPALSEDLPGKMVAAFKTRVFEPGGNFSVDNVATPYYPYEYLAGIRLPQNRWGGNELALNQAGTVELAVVDPEGKPATGRQLKVGVYNVRWRYWWQDNNDNVSRFNTNTHREADQNFTVTTGRDGKVDLPLTVTKWGRYLVRACDDDGHCTGSYFYAGRPADGELDREAAALLPLRTEKEEYAPGETVEVSVPSTESGMILVSLENSAGVLRTEWIEAKSGNNTYRFTAEESMTPNVYVTVQLVQPYSRTENDRPIRMYGVIPVGIVDPATRLEPVLATDDEWEPEATVAVTVSEADRRPMSYTLAVVDEGLLGLTRFTTPDLWEAFFAKEALTVRTYDLFKQVIGAQGSDFNRVLAIGGDGDVEPGEREPRANRFEPVVRHLGPFELEAGAKVTHRIDLPNYVGAVRVMVVAAGDRAYGKADKRVPVRQPLMVLPTLPRVLAPGEEIAMPVNVFAMSEKVKNARVSVRELTGNKVSFTSSASETVRFERPGDRLVRFPFRVGDELGIARFEVVAEGNGERITQEIEIDIQNPNGFQTELQTVTLQPGERREITYAPFGTPATRSATLEAATLPPLNLDRHLRYLMRYPYGCLEQTVSPAFAQLHLGKILELSTEEEEETRRNVMAGLNHLVRFQTASGALAYWPGKRRSQPWATNYALHFMLEAEAAGYTLPVGMREKILSFQRSAASNWRTTVYDYYVNDRQRYHDQAYRLYTLALAGEADLGAMNRLKGVPDLGGAAAHRLGAAYALAGKTNTAKELVRGGNGTIAPYRELSYTFGSQIRDQAMLVESKLLMGEKDEAARMALRLAENVGRRGWLSTQEATFAILAVAKLVGSDGVSKDVLLRYQPGGGSAAEVGSSSAFLQIEMPTGGTSNVFTLTNLGESTLFASVVLTGQPLPGEEKAADENLELTVTYADMNGRPIDPDGITSGTDFVASYVLRNPGSLGMDYREMALRSAVAGGWEIVNERMDLVDDDAKDSHYEYRDYRDAEVRTFFHLPRQDRNTYRLKLTAAYPGRYYLPTQTAEAMYDNEIRAAEKGRWVTVAGVE